MRRRPYQLCVEFGQSRLPVVVEDEYSINHYGQQRGNGSRGSEFSGTLVREDSIEVTCAKSGIASETRGTQLGIWLSDDDAEVGSMS